MTRVSSSIVLSSIAATHLSAFMLSSCDTGVVTSNLDDGNNTLRACVYNATSGSTITFANDMTITLDSEIGIAYTGLTIDGGSHNVTIDGNATTGLFDVKYADLTLSHITLQNGQSPAGAAIASCDSNLTINESVITENNASDVGGAIFSYSYYENTEINITNSTISHNYSDVVGGAVELISSDDEYSTTQKLTINDSNISNNNANKYGGAVGVYAYRSSSSMFDITISNSTFSNNSAVQGGAISTGEYIIGFGPTDINLTISNSTVSGNRAAGNSGAIAFYGDTLVIEDSNISNNESSRYAALVAVGHNVTVSNSRISENRAEGFSGAVIMSKYGNINIENTIVSDNNATAGHHSGLILYGSYGGSDSNITNVTIDNNQAESYSGLVIENGSSVKMTNSTISNNKASGALSGIFVDNGSLDVSNSTISGNESNDYAAGLFVNNGQVTLTHTTITNNTSVTGQAVYVNSAAPTAATLRVAPPGFISVSNSIISGNNVSGNEFENITSLGHNLLGTGTLTTGGTQVVGDIVDVTDPQLEALADNGGNTLTHLPMRSSPAVDTGSSGGLTTDQRGATRPYVTNGFVDMGAVELEHETTGSVGVDGPTTHLEAMTSEGRSLNTDVSTIAGTPPATPPPADAPEGTGDNPVVITSSSQIATGYTQIITFDLPDGSSDEYIGFWKYGPICTGSAPSSEKVWYDFGKYEDNANGTGYQILNGGQQLKVYLVDGILGDDDCVADGDINDDGFPITRANNPIVAVPLSFGAKMALALMMAFGGIWMLGRKEENAS